MRLQEIAVTEGNNVIWENGKLIEGFRNIISACEASDYLTFDAGSGIYNFQMTGK